MKAWQIKENNRTNEHCFYASVILVQIVYNIANVYISIKIIVVNSTLENRKITITNSYE